MNLLSIAQKYFLLIDQMDYEEVSVFQPDDGLVTVETKNSEERYVFSANTPVQIGENGKFSVDTVGGETVRFIAYKTVNLKDEPETPWDDDALQFARLISEIAATQERLDLTALCDAMDLELWQVNQLFDRAHDAWEYAKSKV